MAQLEIRKQENLTKYVDVLWGSGNLQGSKKPPEKLQHRSDMLYQKQLLVAEKVIHKFAEVVSEFEESPTLFEKDDLMQEILIYNRAAQHLKVVLEILDKINREIKFGREKLHVAINGHCEDAELIRHRIRWLERRLEKIIQENSLENLQKVFWAPDVKKLLYEETLVGRENKPQFEGFVRRKEASSPPKSILQGSSRSPFQQRKAVTLPPILREDVVSESFVVLDEADLYWSDDHHRFSYTQNMGSLLEENPISYHNIGLAVPGNYVDRNIFTPGGAGPAPLPWTTEQDPMRGNFDITRDDLEKLLKKIHRIQEKIYLAADLSVDFQPHQVAGKPSSRGFSRDSNRQPSHTPPNLSTPVTSTGAEGRGLSRSIAAGSLARISSSATPNSSSGSPPSVDFLPGTFDEEAAFPLTRTNMGKKFPNSSARWCDLRPNFDSIASQPTIVDQRDLKNKTKLRLFVPKRLKKSTDVVRDLITPSSVTSNRSFRKVNTSVRFVEKLKSSGGNALSDLQKDRIVHLIENLFTSERVDDRVYAARSLSSLGVTATDQVAPALIEKLQQEEASSVRYEIAKALLNLGEWNRSAIGEVVRHLKGGSPSVQSDLLEHLASSQDATTMHLHIDEINELRDLIEILQELSMNPNDDDEVSFQAAVSLGVLCGIYDEKSANITTQKLLRVIQTSKKWSWIAQSLEVLVRRLNHYDETIVKSIIRQLNSATKWQDRLAAALLIGFIGSARILRMLGEDEIFSILDRKLWDDAKREVRIGVSHAMTSLGMRQRLLEALDERIKDGSGEVRSQAVMSMSAAGIRSDKTLRSLVEMLGLDSSDYVRLQIIRMFHSLGITDIRVVRALREREKTGGALGREASKVLASLNVRLTTGASSRNIQRNKESSMSRRTASSSWVSSPWGRELKTSSTFKKPSGGGVRRGRSHCSAPSAQSSPQYRIVSTSVQKLRLSAKSMRRPDSSRSYLTSASSCF